MQQFNLGVEKRLGRDLVLRVDGVHNLGTHFIIGRTIGEVFNPVVGGPDRVVNLESSVNTQYDGLLVSAEKRFADRHWLRASYTLVEGLQLRERRPDPVLQRSDRPERPGPRVRADAQRPAPPLHVLGLLPAALGAARLAALHLGLGVPMDILMPDAQSRVPTLQRNAGGRQFKTPGELNAFLQDQNAAGGIRACCCPW